MRIRYSFSPDHPEEWWLKVLNWSKGFEFAACTNPNQQSFPFEPFRKMIAVGAKAHILSNGKNDFEALKNFHEKWNDWLFGYLGYDLKNQTEPQLASRHTSRTNHPDMLFFVPEHLFVFEKDNVIIHTYSDPEKIIYEINQGNTPEDSPAPLITFSQVMSEKDYLRKAQAVINHIIEGDVYELNLCMEFFAENIKIDPLSVYLKLIGISPTPFSGFLKFRDHFLISASPERFLKKEGKTLISQPIKGTARRHENAAEDERLKELLHQDEKERAENMMIVDLVRNDLSRSSEYGSVKVEELFKVYSFRQWHQMISTVSGIQRDNYHWTEVIKNAFPMGSMTGAPKIKVMELIEKYETSRRGVYSGAFGYVTPEGNFDFNVIIRSLFYNSHSKAINFQVGSALTYDSIPVKEYQECLLKASAIFQLFSHRTDF